MKSKWYELKEKTIQLRRKGRSIPWIEKRLGIPRSTLSGWFKNVSLTKKQRDILQQRWKEGLVKARRKAVQWHNTQKENRLEVARNAALQTLEKIDTADIRILELALALLYLGEGSKKDLQTSMGSSDPLILQFFLAALKKVYRLNPNNFRCELSLRADQDPEAIKRFWSRELQLPLTSFRGVNIDQRTKGSKTYTHYKGVCHIRCGNIAIQRKLLYLSQFFCKRVIK